MALIIDEVFLDYPLKGPAPRSFAGGDPSALTLVLSGLSKIVGLPQMKLSWIVVAGPEPLKRNCLERLEQVADLFLSPAGPVQLATPELLAFAPRAAQKIGDRIRANHRWLEESLGGSSPLSVLPAEAGWNATLRLPAVMDSDDWALTLLRDHSVYLHPGSLFGFDLESVLVGSLLTPTSVFREGVSKILQAVSDRVDCRDG